MSRSKVADLSVEEKSHFITAVQEHPCLWDVSSAAFKQKAVKDTKWAKIAEDFGFPDAKAAQVAFKNLKDTYGQQRKKVTGASGAAADDTAIKWVHYAELRFLDAVKETRETQNTITLSQQEQPSGSSASTETEDEKPFRKPQEQIRTPASKRVRRSDTESDPLIEAVARIESVLDRNESQTFADYVSSQVDEIAKLDEQAAVDIRAEVLLLIAKRRGGLLAAMKARSEQYPPFHNV